MKFWVTYKAANDPLRLPAYKVSMNTGFLADFAAALVVAEKLEAISHVSQIQIEKIEPVGRMRKP